MQLRGLFPWGFLYSPHLELIQFTTYSVAISMRREMSLLGIGFHMNKEYTYSHSPLWAQPDLPAILWL